jgi:hypothetical protein
MTHLHGLYSWRTFPGASPSGSRRAAQKLDRRCVDLFGIAAFTGPSRTAHARSIEVIQLSLDLNNFLLLP